MEKIIDNDLSSRRARQNCLLEEINFIVTFLINNKKYCREPFFIELCNYLRDLESYYVKDKE